MQLELPFFLISVVDSNIIYSHVPFIFSVIYIYIYIATYVFFVHLEL